MLYEVITQKYIDAVKADYENVRQFQGQRKAKEYLTLDEARANRYVSDWDKTPIYRITSYNVCYTKLLRLCINSRI